MLAEVGDRLANRPADPRLRWLKIARPDQLHPVGRWRVWYVQGGRGGGKTRTGAQELADWVLSDDEGEGEYGIVAPTYADAWTKCVEGESGLLRALGTSMKEVKAHTSATVKNAWRTYGQVILHNGIVVYIDSAAEGGLRIQGRNLKGAWCDEIGLWLNWETCWNESLKYAVRMGRSQIVATATPKASRPARKLIRSLIKNDDEHGGVAVTKLRTIDNKRNLSEEFLRAVIGSAKGTRLERQELDGELLDDVANALWSRDLLDRIVVAGVGQPGGPRLLRSKVLGVDPSDGAEDSDEQAYTLVGEGLPGDDRLYVAENWGGQEAPAPFARRCLLKAVAEEATIVVEKNHGGAWLVTVFDQVSRELIEKGIIDRKPRVVVVHASQAKRTRAEPVSALYERDLVRHCHRISTDEDGHLRPDEHMPELEDQMATFTGAQGERSPDRLDSLVWAATRFLKKTWGQDGTPRGARKWADAQELAELVPDSQQRGRRQLTPDQAEYLTMDDPRNPDSDAALDSFAPQNDPDSRPTRSAVHSWH